MSRFFEVVEVEEENPKFLIVGESAIAQTLVQNLLTSLSQVFYLTYTPLPTQDNLYQLTRNQVRNISENIQFIFFEKEPLASLEFEIKKHLPSAKAIYLNPRSLKSDAIMLFSPLIYGPGLIDEAFGFLALNQKSIIYDSTLIFPENLSDEISPIYFLDMVEEIEKAMFTMSVSENQNLILLSGPEKTPLSAFLGGLRARIKTDLKIKYLSQKLVFRMPNAGRVEKGHTILEKGLEQTAEWLREEIDKNPTSYKAKSPNLLSSSPHKNIPVASPIDESEEFALSNNFLKNVYRENIDFLQKNQLTKVGVKPEKKPENSIIKQKINHFFEILAKISKFRLKRPSSGKPIFKIVRNLFLLIILPPFIYFLILSFSLFSLSKSFNFVRSFDITKARFWSSSAEYSRIAASFLNRNVMKYYYLLLNKENSYNNNSSLLALEKQAVHAENNALNFYENLSAVLTYTFGKTEDEDVQAEKKFQNAAVMADAAKNDAASIIASLKNNIPSLPLFLRFKNKDYYAMIKSLPSYYKDLNTASSLSRAMPEILGASDKKTYAIIFQNNMEIRSTGGFIGSFALITFEKLKLVDFSVFDVYDADGQLKGHISPPPEILHFLKQPDFFLRDANVAPNFPDSAQRVEWFLAKEMRAKVDGVFAIDISFVEDMLKNTGPIYLSDFQETVSSQNLFEKAERAAEVNFFPGSTKKKDFLSILANSIWSKIISLPNENLVKIFPVARDSIETRHLQVYFEDPAMQQLSQILGADGVMLATGNSYLNIIENNYGANKANYFVKRKIDHQIEITPDGFVHNVLKISYANFSPLSMWPTGEYKPYVKLYANKDVIFNDFIFENKKPKLSEFLNEFVLEELKPETEQLVLQGEENDKKYFGTFLTVPVGETRDVTFSWQSSAPDLELLKNFSFYFQKQAGVVKDDYDLKIVYPQALEVSSNINPVVAEGGLLQYNLNTERDINLQLKFK